MASLNTTLCDTLELYSVIMSRNSSMKQSVLVAFQIIISSFYFSLTPNFQLPEEFVTVVNGISNGPAPCEF